MKSIDPNTIEITIEPLVLKALRYALAAGITAAVAGLAAKGFAVSGPDAAAWAVATAGLLAVPVSHLLALWMIWVLTKVAPQAVKKVTMVKAIFPAAKLPQEGNIPFRPEHYEDPSQIKP